MLPLLQAAHLCNCASPKNFGACYVSDFSRSVWSSRAEFSLRSAPMPYIIGIPSELMPVSRRRSVGQAGFTVFYVQAVMAMDLGEVVIVDADENRVTTPHRDVQDLPAVVVKGNIERMVLRSHVLICCLQISSIRSADGKMFGDGVARAFMRALVELIGGYRFGLT